MKKILVVDDDEAMHRLLTHILHRSGYEVECVLNAEDAYRALSTQSPDLILCDIFMPVTDGFQLLAQLREMPQFEHIPIAMISTCSDVRSRRRAQELGANAFIVKPFLPKDLIDTIDKLMQTAQPI